jgi:hypothetical protein
MINERNIGDDLEENGRRLTAILPGYLNGGTKKKHGKIHDSGYYILESNRRQLEYKSGTLTVQQHT